VSVVCKVRVHKQCAVMAASMPCKWTTLASVGDEIIEEDDGVSSVHHLILFRTARYSFCSIPRGPASLAASPLSD